jgi:hypothetical protein
MWRPSKSMLSVLSCQFSVKGKCGDSDPAGQND